MKHFFDRTGTIEGLCECLSQCSRHTDISGILILCADENGFTPDLLDPVLQQCTLPIAGGVFPGIIHDNRLYSKGSLIIGLSDVISIQTVTGLSDTNSDFEKILDRQMADSSNVSTLILFVDGFATRISSFIESLFNVFGLDFNYVGGGAGSLSMQRKPYLLTREGMKDDCAVLAFLAMDSGVGVCHGWQELSGPYQVTSVEKNIIHSIEWQTAFTFYQRVLKEEAGVSVTIDDFYTAAQHFPFGIARLSGEQVVRDPYQVNEDGSLVCVGEIEEGAFLSILKGENDRLIEAAAKSLKRAVKAFPGHKQAGSGFFVDCISRVIVLGDDFSRELEAVQAGGLPFSGICSIGEIANSGVEYLELYNKTSVMAVFEQK